MVGCQYFPESTFELANESRLPKWITLPPRLTRADVSITMNYYIKPWDSSATFILQNEKGQIVTKVDGKVKGTEPLHLKNPPQGFPPGYPSYEVTTVNGITDIIVKPAQPLPPGQYIIGEGQSQMYDFGVH